MNYHFGRGWSRLTPYLMLLPGIAFYFLISLGPSLATSVYSLTDATGLKGAAVHWLGLANYKEFLMMGQASKDNMAALGRTLIFCFFVTTLQFGLGLATAVILNNPRIRLRNFFRTLYFMPVILGAVIQGMIWSLFLYPMGGPVAKLLALFGAHSEFFGGLPSEAFAWVIVVQIWANMGVTMVIFLAGLQTIPSELYEAARIDGANTWQVFSNVTWPLLTPSVNTNLLLNIIGSLQAWQLFLVLLGYRNGTQVLGYLIYATGFGQTSGSVTSSFRQGYAAAASMILFALVLVIGMLTQTLLRRREERIMG
ncbi:carbohydrate ABC transporter membrane protein 1, CUT1 family [Longilinea arvoryzae]|uniref:Carbohydrate ABC transporter membrane protein 1, CUT1 family n=1 Tax=Longilinea arvoryzae TaxID=360412 RepID=A0A0S7BDD4_9CHLR|nr:sugar ABC transporter permease [Longilinea arvoryzae]GAP15774.1 carbohydrate ABC transporter membrane protein 1, CUT1 family [Longilinea arvoryzae]